MGGTTSLGIRYPYQSEVVDSVDYANLATDVNALLIDLDTIATLANTRPSVHIQSGSRTGFTTGLNQVLQNFTLVWDTGNFWDPAQTDRIILRDPGLYYVFIGGSFRTLASTTTSFRIAILANAGTEWQSRKIDTLASSGNGNDSAVSGMVIASVADTTIQFRCQWTGTGGPVSVTSGNIKAYLIRELADL
jgi:hypothetical protein